MHTKCTCAVPRHGQLPPHFAAGNEAAARELAGCHGKFAVLDLAATDDVTDADIVGGSQKGHRRAGLPQRTPKVIGIAPIAAHSQRSPSLLSAAPSVLPGSRVSAGSDGSSSKPVEVLDDQKPRELGQLGRQEFAVPTRSCCRAANFSCSGVICARSSRSPPLLYKKWGKNRPLVDFIGFFALILP